MVPGRGIGSRTSGSQVAIGCREAWDRRADVTARRERSAGGQGARGEHASGVQVAAGVRAREGCSPGFKNRSYKNLLNGPPSRQNSAFLRHLSSRNILAKLFLAGWRKCDGRSNYVRGENPAFRLG